LSEGFRAWKIYEYEWAVAQETLGEWMTTGICGRIARSNELNSLKRDPLFILRPPVPIVLSDLSEEGNDGLSTVLISVWKINLITEHYKPLVGVCRP